jgi:hypothetical protein
VEGSRWRQTVVEVVVATAVHDGASARWASEVRPCCFRGRAGSAPARWVSEVGRGSFRGPRGSGSGS